VSLTKCTIVLKPGTQFEERFKAAATKEPREAVCIRAVLAAVSRSLQRGARSETTLDESGLDGVKEDLDIGNMHKAVKVEGPLRDVAVLVVIDEVGESTAFCHGVCRGRLDLYKALLNYFGAVQVALCGTGAWQLGASASPGTDPDSYALTDLSMVDPAFVTKLADCFHSNYDDDRADPLFMMMATNARVFSLFLEALDTQCPEPGDAAPEDPRVLRSLTAAANWALGKYLQSNGLCRKTNNQVRMVARQALAAVMLQRHDIAADKDVRGLLTSQSYRAQEIELFKEQHKSHPAVAKMSASLPDVFIVLDIVPALLLLIFSTFGGVEMDVVRSPEVLERFSALYLHARLDALFYCAKAKLILPDELVPTLLAPFRQSGTLKPDKDTPLIRHGTTQKPLLHLEQPFPATRGGLRPLLSLASSEKYAQVVVNGPRAPFADAWLSMPLEAEGQHLFLAVQAKHVGVRMASACAARCDVAAECVTAGLLSERMRLSAAAATGTKRQRKVCAETLKKWTRSHWAWAALCGGKANLIVYLVFITNGTFESAALEDMKNRADVCFFGKDNADALVPFARALPLLRAPRTNAALNSDDGATAAAK